MILSRKSVSTVTLLVIYSLLFIVRLVHSENSDSEVIVQLLYSDFCSEIF